MVQSAKLPPCLQRNIDWAETKRNSLHRSGIYIFFFCSINYLKKKEKKQYWLNGNKEEFPPQKRNLKLKFNLFGKQTFFAKMWWCSRLRENSHWYSFWHFGILTFWQRCDDVAGWERILIGIHFDILTFWHFLQRCGDVAGWERILIDVHFDILTFWHFDILTYWHFDILAKMWWCSRLRENSHWYSWKILN